MDGMSLLISLVHNGARILNENEVAERERSQSDQLLSIKW